jgi:hypothetical protein
VPVFGRPSRRAVGGPTEGSFRTNAPWIGTAVATGGIHVDVKPGLDVERVPRAFDVHFNEHPQAGAPVDSSSALLTLNHRHGQYPCAIGKSLSGGHSGDTDIEAFKNSRQH